MYIINFEALLAGKKKKNFTNTRIRHNNEQLY